MRFLLHAIIIHFKRYFSPAYVIVLLILVAAAGSFVVHSSGGIALKIGVVYDESGEVQSKIIKNMNENGITLIKYGERADLEKDIINKKIICGYVFNDIESKLKENDYENYAVMIRHSGSTVSDITKEMFFASVVKVLSANIAAKYIGETADLQAVREEIASLYERNLLAKSYVVNEKSTSTEQQPASLFNGVQVTHGVIALVVYMFYIFTAAGKVSRPRHICKMHSLVSGLAELFSLTAAGFILCVCGVLFIYLLFPQFVAPHEFSSAVAYCFCLSGLCVFLMKIDKQLVASLPIVTIIAHVLFGNIFFDLNDLSKNLAVLQMLFPSSHYWIALNNGQIFLLFLIGIIFVFLNNAVRKNRT